jgi:hypothetical protein
MHMADHHTTERVSDAIADPTREFATPMAVVDDTGLELDEKQRILESWRKDAELLSTAQSENMTGGEGARLQDVSIALQKLEELRGGQA